MKRWEAAKKSYVREEVCTVDIWRNGDDEEEERRVKYKSYDEMFRIWGEK